MTKLRDLPQSKLIVFTKWGFKIKRLSRETIRKNLEKLIRITKETI